MADIKGVCPVIAAPFTDQGEVDYHSFDKMIAHLVDTGVNGLTLFGIASEFYKLTDAEKYQLAEVFINKLKGTNVFSMISITDHSTDVAVHRAKQYQEMGADCLMVLPPHFLAPSNDAIKEHIKQILEAVNIPVVIQYAPGETKVQIPVEDMVDIYDHYPNAVFKIEENPPVNYIQKLLNQRPKAAVLVGYAGLYMIDVLNINGQGVMPGCSFSEIYVAIYRHYLNGQVSEAAKLHNKLRKYLTRWMQDCEYIIQVEKTILYQRKIIASEYCRRPNYPISQKDRDIISDFLSEFAEYLRKGA